nr:uncharacterized protein LOC129271950 [Lytechinus pictus]
MEEMPSKGGGIIIDQRHPQLTNMQLWPACHTDEEVDMVYEEIAKLLDEDRANFTIVMGDFNAKVGKMEDSSEVMLGKFGIGTRNDRGDRLLEFALSRGLKVMNSFFKKKEHRKWTWQSPNGTTRNEIDFILTNRPAIVKDVSVLNRFNTGDHRLVRAKMHVNFKLERCKLIRKKNASLNVDKLKQCKDEFQLQLRNRFQVLQDEVNQEDVNDIYDKFSHTVQNCALEMAGKREYQTNDKITKETLDLMRKRRQMKVSTQKDSIEYTEFKVHVDTPIIAQDTDEDIPPVRVDEVAKSLQAMKRGKAPGSDEVLVDVLKDGGDVILEQLAKLFTLCLEMYSQANATIHLHKDSDEFPINRVVRQGDTVSPKLFNAALEEIIRKLDWESTGLNIEGECLHHLRFADDIFLITDDGHKLENMLNDLNTESNKYCICPINDCRFIQLTGIQLPPA